MSLTITGGRCLFPEGLVDGDLRVEDGRIAPAGASKRRLDARGLLVLPGIVDLHGDAFERQIQPRPGVSFPIPIGLADTEAQLLANGITTAFHGITLSWEPGLRSVQTWTALLDALDAARPHSACDMRVHLRWETYNMDALDVALGALASGHVGLLAFNDHTPSIIKKLADPVASAKYAERAGLTVAAFRALAERVASRGAEVEAASVRLAAAGVAAGVPMASHDDDSVATRDGFRARGARICEFPITDEVARAAAAASDWVAMGSPNVVRGGSHLGWTSAAAMAQAGICRVLTSDYYYPALLQAPFVLAASGGLDFAASWALVAGNPAEAAGLTDRGRLEEGLRADMVLVSEDPRPHVVATIAGGRLVFGTAEGFDRLS